MESNWISVKEQLPPLHQKVLISRINPQGERTYDVAEYSFKRKWLDWKHWVYLSGKITHWQPLPEHPDIIDEKEKISMNEVKEYISKDYLDNSLEQRCTLCEFKSDGRCSECDINKVKTIINSAPDSEKIIGTDYDNLETKHLVECGMIAQYSDEASKNE